MMAKARVFGIRLPKSGTARAPAARMDCPDNREMQSFVEGRLSRQRRRELQGHIESCADCYEASVELAHQLDCEQEPESSQLLLTRESDSTWVAEEPPTSQAPTSRRNDKLLDPGAMVDHFRVIRLLGRGSMGAVYLARDTELGRKVALKIVRDSSARRGQTLQRFAQEARTTAKFNHPHIVTVYAVGEIQGLPYVALEYLEGQNLMERMAELEI